MSRRRHGRWRDRRDSLPARRRQRRHHRRDIPRSGYYEPIRVDASAARRGVQRRLGGAIASLLLAMGLTAGCFLIPGSRFLITMLATMAIVSFSAAVALMLSARREEVVHQLASELQQGKLLPPPDDLGADGSV